MSSSLQVRIARAGKEIGTYEPAEAVRLFGLGTLRPTDHYWHSGMTGWGPLPEYIERLRSEAQAVQQKPARARVRKITPSQEAYLQFLGAVVAPGMSMDDASRAIDEIHSKGGYREGWSFQKHIIYPNLYPGPPAELWADFKSYVKSRVVGSSEKLTDAKVNKVFSSLWVKNTRWYHPETRLEVAYDELVLLFPGCCDGRPIRQYGEITDSLHNYVRSRVVGCSEKLTRERIVDVIESLCLKDQNWIDKPSRNDLFWDELKRRFPACCDGHPPSPASDSPSAGSAVCPDGPLLESAGPGVVQPSKSSGCVLILLIMPTASVLLYLFCL